MPGCSLPGWARVWGSVDWTAGTLDHVSVLVLSLQLPKAVVPVTFLPSGWALLGLGCMFMAGRGGIDGTDHGKGHRGPADLAKGAAFALRGIWWLKCVAFDTRQC